MTTGTVTACPRYRNTSENEKEQMSWILLKDQLKDLNMSNKEIGLSWGRI